MRASLLDRIRATNSTLTVVLAACLSLAPMPLRANEFWDVTYLVGLTQGSSRLCCTNGLRGFIL